MPNEFIVPIDGLYAYSDSETWEPFKPNMKSQLYGIVNKKYNEKKIAKRYKKAVKHLKKAAKYLPLEFVIEVKVEFERRANDEQR